MPDDHGSDPIVENPSNLFILMELFEEFTHLCHTNKIQFWIDWGTELGALRHSNLIPWDIDCDTCLTEDNYQKLLKLFDDNNNTIGNLTCDSNGYNDRNGCCWIFNKKYLYLGKDYFGIDCISYRVNEYETKTLMSQATIDRSPATNSSYDYLNHELYPLKLVPLVGNFVFMPNKAVDLMKRYYGDGTYLNYPEHQYKQWLELNSDKLFLLDCPFKIIPEVQSISDGFNLSLPFLIRNPSEFKNITIEKIKELFIQETQISSWYETKNEIFTEELSNTPLNLMNKWEDNKLTTNITDSPLKYLDFLPTFLRERIPKLEESYQPWALCYVLSNENTLTKFHQDIGGGGWIYLKQGKKLWWFISPDDIVHLEKENYPIEALRNLSFTELVFLNNYYLWGKVYITLMKENDFVYFPEHWAHRVYTYEKACGISGYAR